MKKGIIGFNLIASLVYSGSLLNIVILVISTPTYGIAVISCVKLMHECRNRRCRISTDILFI